MGVVLIAGTKKGAAVYHGDGARGSWSPRFELKGWSVTASARDAGGRWYLGVASDVYGPAIFASDDGLQSFRQLEAAPRYAEADQGSEMHNRMTGGGNPFAEPKGSRRFVDQIWTLHAAGDALYAGVSEAGVFVSRDRGESWQPMTGFNEHPSRKDWMPGAGGLCAHAILTDAKNPDRIWVGVSAAGVFRSDDGGKTFARRNDGVPGDVAFCVHGLAHDPDDAATIYRQDHFGMYRTLDGGDSWHVIEDGLPVQELSSGTKASFGFPIVMDRKSRRVFIVPMESDNFRMPANGRLAVYSAEHIAGRNQGPAWAEKRTGLPEPSYAGVLRGAMAADQLDPGGIYFGTTSGTLYGSNDLGESWSEIAAGLPRIQSVRAFSV